MAGEPLTEFERKQVERLLSDPSAFPREFKNWLPNYLEINPPLLPFSQIIGYNLNNAQYSYVDISTTTTSTGFGDGSSAGPTITGLADGKYLVVFGTSAKASVSSHTVRMKVYANGSALGTADGAGTALTEFMSISQAVIGDLSNGGDNTLAGKFAVDVGGETGTFHSRWIAALRYSNL